jgi:hypothetical protein
MRDTNNASETCKSISVSLSETASTRSLLGASTSMATAQHPAAPPAVRRKVSRPCAPPREMNSSGASSTRCSASSPSAHSSSSTSSQTSKRSKGPSPMATRSSSSTACPWSASSSGSSSSCPSSITASTASGSGSAASPTSSTTPGPATGCTSRPALHRPHRLRSTSRSTSYRQRFIRCPASRASLRRLRTRSSRSLPTPGCSPSTSSP